MLKSLAEVGAPSVLRGRGWGGQFWIILRVDPSVARSGELMATFVRPDGAVCAYDYSPDAKFDVVS